MFIDILLIPSEFNICCCKNKIFILFPTKHKYCGNFFVFANIGICIPSLNTLNLPPITFGVRIQQKSIGTSVLIPRTFNK